MCNDILDDSDMEWIADLIGSCCLKEDNPLVIVASSYSTSFRSFFYSNMQKNRNLPLVAIDIDCSTKKGKERFEDLALVLGCKYYDKYNGNDKIEDITSDDLGVCKRVVGNDLHCKFIGGYGFNQQQDKIQERIQELEEEYNVVCKQDENSLEEKDYDLFLIKKRIAMLQCSMATLYVGGKTELERETRKFLLEDAVYACRSTIDNGYIVGGNLIVPKVIYKHENAIVSDLLESDSLSYLKSYSFDNDGFFHFVLSELDKAFKQSFIQVLTNAHISVEEAKDIIDNCIKHDEIFNVKTREYESDTETKVINSVDTDIEIIKASFSIIGLLATSNQFITSNIVSPNNQ
jgi:chaperonin GroEL (HSP60 family)